jgi:hypothetical protein
MTLKKSIQSKLLIKKKYSIQVPWLIRLLKIETLLLGRLNLDLHRFYRKTLLVSKTCIVGKSGNRSDRPIGAYVQAALSACSVCMELANINDYINLLTYILEPECRT